jgi:hypothetical protein
VPSGRYSPHNGSVGLATTSGETVTTDRRLAGGSRGEVFAVASHPGMVLNRYLPGALAADPSLQRRLTVMTARRPPAWRGPGGADLVLAWPSDVVLDDGRFAGYLMPAADMEQTVALDQIASASGRAAAAGPAGWAREVTWRYLVSAAASLAHASNVLHGAGVIAGDVSTAGVRAWPQAGVTLLNCESMQIRDPYSGEWFYCHGGRHEFTPPELAGASRDATARRPSSDLFTLAVQLYQVLLDGEHPFRGRWRGSGETPAVPDLAARGIWAGQDDGPLQPPRAAAGGRLLPPGIISLFRQAFEDGAANPLARPTAAAWHQALAALAGDLVACAADPGHVYPASMQACPWCGHPRPSRRPAEGSPGPAAGDEAGTGGQAGNAGQGAAGGEAGTGSHGGTGGQALPGGAPGTSTALRQQTPSTSAPVTPGQPLPRPARPGRHVTGSAIAAVVVVLVLVVIGVRASSLGTSPDGVGSLPSPVRAIPGDARGATAVAFSPGGTTLASADVDDAANRDSGVSLWSVRTGNSLTALAPAQTLWYDAQPARPSAVAFSPGGTTLAAAYTDGTATAWDPATGQAVASFIDPGNTRSEPAGAARPLPGPARLDAEAFSPGGATLALGDSHGTTYLWDLAEGRVSATLADPEPGAGVTAVAYSADGAALATEDTDRDVDLWNAATGKIIASVGSGRATGALAFSPDGSTLAVGQANATIGLWDTATGTSIATLYDTGSPVADIAALTVTGLAFSHAGTLLAASDNSGYTSVWDVATRQATTSFIDPATGAGGATSVAFSPGGQLLATGDSNGSAYLWRATAR